MQNVVWQRVTKSLQRPNTRATGSHDDRGDPSLTLRVEIRQLRFVCRYQVESAWASNVCAGDSILTG